MSVYFAAVHQENSWRKHSKHDSLDTATTGPDGAENLLRNRGRVREKNAKYGMVCAVFVWGDTMKDANALRLLPGSSYEIERAQVPVELLKKFKPKFQRRSAAFEPMIPLDSMR